MFWWLETGKLLLVWC